MKMYKARPIFIATMMWTSLFANEMPEDFQVCCTPDPFRIGIRHIEAKGIGYKEGYTTLEALFTPFFECTNFIPLFDIRGHVFDNGKFAANGGLGFRYLAQCHVFGLNGYYDFRQTHRRNYNQAGLGLEYMGGPWEVHANGYVSLGRRTSRKYDPLFKEFEGHHILLKYKQKTSLQGADAEVGYNFGCWPNTRLYFGAGPYYLNGKKDTHIWGGQARLMGRYRDFITLTFSTSYDNVFRYVAQGEVGLSFSFGPNKLKSCCPDPILMSRIAQPVVRHEIIPIATRKHSAVAINPATGLPYVVWFVDNTSSSNGTFESPFNNLADAQNASGPNEMIYIFPGNGDALDGGIVLKNGQFLFGSAVDHAIATQFGRVVIPRQSTTLPLLTNTLGLQEVTLANNNEVSGLHIIPTNRAIFGTNISNGNINRNWISTNSTNRIEFVDVSGLFLIDGNVISSPVLAINGILITNNATKARFSITNNNISSCVTGLNYTGFSSNAQFTIADNTFANGTNALDFNPLGSSRLGIDMHDNVLDAFSGVGVQTNSQGTSIINGTIRNNKIVAFNNVFNARLEDDTQTNICLIDNRGFTISADVFVQMLDNAHATIKMGSNEFHGSTDRTLFIEADDNSVGTFCVTGNRLIPSIGTIASFITTGAGAMCVKYQRNIGIPEKLVVFDGANIRLEPFVGNVGQLDTTAAPTIQFVPQGTCGCSGRCP